MLSEDTRACFILVKSKVLGRKFSQHRIAGYWQTTVWRRRIDAQLRYIRSARRRMNPSHFAKCAERGPLQPGSYSRLLCGPKGNVISPTEKPIGTVSQFTPFGFFGLKHGAQRYVQTTKVRNPMRSILRPADDISRRDIELRSVIVEVRCIGGFLIGERSENIFHELLRNEFALAFWVNPQSLVTAKVPQKIRLSVSVVIHQCIG